MNERSDLFTLIHKGLRWWMGDVSARLGSTNVQDASCLHDVVMELLDLLEAIDEHGQHEETFIAPVLDARANYRSRDWHEDHVILDRLTASLRSQAESLLEGGAAVAQQPKLVLDLYRAFARYTAEMFVHLDWEETTLMPLLWSVCSDDDLAGIMAAYRAAHGAEAAVLYARIAAAFTSDERELLGV